MACFIGMILLGGSYVLIPLALFVYWLVFVCGIYLIDLLSLF